MSRPEQLSHAKLLELIDSGLTTLQMAQILYVAPGTVRTHLKSIYRKLGVCSGKKAVE